MENGENADAGTEMLGIGCDLERGLSRGFEEQVVDHGLILVGDGADLRRQREHDVEVRHLCAVTAREVSDDVERSSS